MGFWSTLKSEVQRALQNREKPKMAMIKYTGGISGGSGGQGIYSYPAGGGPGVYQGSLPPQSQSGLLQQGMQQQSGMGHSPLLGPSGHRTTITFVAADGLHWAISVDDSYINLLQQISQLHQTIGPGYMTPVYAGQQAKPAVKMLEGDFSEDEMVQAEQIIEEMKHDEATTPC